MWSSGGVKVDLLSLGRQGCSQIVEGSHLWHMADNQRLGQPCTFVPIIWPLDDQSLSEKERGGEGIVLLGERVGDFGIVASRHFTSMWNYSGF